LTFTHSIGWYDFTSWNSEEEFLNNLTKMKEEYLKYRVTTFLPTTVTLPKEVLLEACKVVGEVQDDSIPGMYLEGPFINEKYAGAQDTKYIRTPDLSEVKQCIELSMNKVKTSP